MQKLNSNCQKKAWVCFQAFPRQPWLVGMDLLANLRAAAGSPPCSIATVNAAVKQSPAPVAERLKETELSNPRTLRL